MSDRNMIAGRYYVGDLCYVFSSEDWDQVCKLIIDGDYCLSGHFNLPDGRRIALYGTKWGDGRYTDQQGHEYLVDSGTIGCVLLEHTSKGSEDNYNGGHVHDMLEPFLTNYEDGVIVIGDVRIDTDPEEEEDDEGY